MIEAIKNLKEQVEGAFRCKAQHIESVPVFELFEGKVIWDGVVETFDIEGHPKAKRCYAFHFIDADESGEPTAGRLVLNLPPVDSPQTAVKLAIERKRKRND